ncbi:MAG: tetratricopeptide repeat protein [Paludibacteraceae bacterium]|nr:tetratricopeptide repeat protein [Paludibacteraceae bacterium]
MQFEPEIQQLLQRFESTLQQGVVQYYDTDELETIIDCYIASEQLDKARIALDYAYRVHPTSNEIRCKEGKLLLMEGAYENAIKTLEPIQNTDPDYIAILAECYLRIYKFNKSKELFSQYLTLCDTNELSAIFADIASLYNTHNQPELALEFIESGIALFPDDITLITEKAIALEQSEQLDEAAKLFNIALDNNPYQPELWCMLGSILFRQNNFTEAIRAYDYALAIEPNDTLTRLQRGHCLFNLGLFNEAIEPYEEYLAENPDDAVVITFLAETYENIDNIQRAKELYLQALAIYDEIPEAWIGLASCQHDIDGLVAAYETIKQADEKFPENQHIIYCMSRIEADLAAANFDDFLLNQSLQHLLFCLENDPENETLNFETANILLQFGDYENAIKLYEIAYDKNPFIEKITLFMSMNYFALGNTEQAKKFLDIARETISNADEIFLSLFPNAQTLIK